MTAILTNPRAKTLGRSACLLLVGASGLALAAPLAANDLLFTTSEARPVMGQRTDQRAGLTQIALTGGGTVSIVDAAEYRLNADGSIDLYEGTITVASGNADEVVVRMPEGLEGRVAGAGAAGNFSVRENGEASGHALTGAVRIGRVGSLERFGAGAMWRARTGGEVRRVVANDAQVQPDAAPTRPAEPGAVVPIGGDAGPVAAALNGIPTVFGDQLAAAGASSDIVAAARRIEAVVGDPTLETFPSGDFALLVAAASRLEDAFGGQPFPEAQADIIRAYLRFLEGGGAGSGFLAAYSGFAVSYLDLIRAGGLPSGFAGAAGGAGAVDVEAYLAYIRRTGALADLAARDRVLAEAYLSFLASGGDRDRFAVSFTDLTRAYFAFVRGGGDPAAFTGASEAALTQTIAFLADSGLVVQLGAADRALVEAFLANGGLAFAGQYEAALGDYFAFLASGRLPSDYAALDQATLRAYLETLADTGLLATVLGERAGFYADYLAFLRAGGDVDGFAGLPANIFAGYAAQLAAYRAFLDAGNLPSAFAATDAAQLQAFIAELQAAGALERFLGADAAFFAAFADFVRGGGAFDAFAGLNANIFAGYASALQAYFAFLERGGVPSTYGPLSQAVIAQYLAELEAAGALARFLPDTAGFYAAYLAFLSQGGNPDTFAGLPVPPDFGAFAAALNAYADFLAGGGLPSDFTGEDLAILASYVAALADAGEIDARLGANASLLGAYFAFLAQGGAPDAFSGLPVYADYVTALNAYFAFLAGGGLPDDYAVLDQATINAYLAALAAAQGGLTAFADLDGFFAAYAAFVLGGGDPARFAGLPVYADYVAALNAYFDFLAGGGVPSGYTVLDQTTIEAYLAALAGVQGGLAGFAALNAFFVDYFAFIQGGGDPDRFAGLPGGGSGGGGTGGAGTNPPGAPAMLAGYTGGFDPATAKISILVGGVANGATFQGSEIGFDASPYTLDADGGLASYTRQPGGQVRSRGTAQQTDIFGNADAVIGRWTNGSISIPNTFTFSANQGLHYLLTRPAAPDILRDLTGRVDYYLIGATRPTIADGSLAPGVFDAGLAIALGSDYRLAMEGTITMPTASDPYVFSFASAGGLADPSQSATIIGPGTNNIFFTALPATDNAGNCTANPDLCVLNLRGTFAGGVDTIGMTYEAVTSGRSTTIIGAAIFEAGPERNFGGGGTGGTGGTPPTTTRTGQNLAFANLFIGDDAVSGGSVTVDDQGRIVAYQSRDREVFRQGSTRIVESGTAAGITWTRWADGTPEGDYYGTTAFDPVGANGGWHVIAGDALSNIPASGTIAYTLAGWTTPTRTGEGSSAGSVSGSAAVQFGSTPRFGLDLTVTSGADQIRMATDGGVTDVSQSRLTIDSAGIFSSRASNPEIVTTNLAGAFCAAGCLSFVQGFLSGTGASGAGLSYAIRQEGVTPQGFINGTAAFAKGDVIAPPPPTGTGNPVSATVSTDHIITQSNISPARNLATTIGIGNVEYDTDAAGQIVAFRQAGTNLVERIGTAQQADTGRTASGLVRWTRWTDGTIDVLGTTDQQLTFSADQGYHTIVGTPATDLPDTGRIDFALVGGTRPTSRGGVAAPGSLVSGGAAVQFGSEIKVGIELAFQFAGETFNAQTAGGLSNLSLSEISLTPGLSIFTGTGAFGGVTSSGDYCVSTCRMSWTGFLAGAGGSEMGLSYLMLPRTGTNIRIMGTAAFARVPASGGTVGGGVSIAPSAAPIAGIDMNRWGGTGSASPQGRPVSMGAQGLSLLPPGLAAGESAVAGDPLARTEAIRHAERLMGGMITFAPATPDTR